MTKSDGRINDNFMAMVTAKAEVTLPLSDFQPQSTLVTAEHHVERARFPVIDYHNHLDALDPVEVLRIMDACGIERIVNITMKVGDEALRMRIASLTTAGAGSTNPCRTRSKLRGQRIWDTPRMTAARASAAGCR